MHDSSMREMTAFRDMFMNKENPLSILDVGSMDVNGSYRKLFENPMWSYTGLDIAEGKNVDVVVGPSDWSACTGPFNVVVSGQCAEHVKDIYQWFRNVYSMTVTGGLCCIIVPWRQKEHDYPVDCWRIMPEGMRFLLEEIAGFTVVDVHKNDEESNADCVGIGYKELK